MVITDNLLIIILIFGIIFISLIVLWPQVQPYIQQTIETLQKTGAPETKLLKIEFVIAAVVIFIIVAVFLLWFLQPVDERAPIDTFTPVPSYPPVDPNII